MKQPQFYLQDEAYARGHDNGHTVYIARDTQSGGKVVSSFETMDQFLVWFDKQPTPKNFYEKIINERVEYYDIDGKIKDNDYWKNDKTTIINDFLKLRMEWIHTSEYMNKHIDIDKDLFILDSSGPEKKSFHIIIRNGWVFRTNIEQKQFILDFQKFLIEKNTGFVIDPAPYSANQCFRTLGSCKSRDSRVLERSDYNLLSLECDRRLFFPSWIRPELEIAREESWISLENAMGREENLFFLKYVSTGKTVEPPRDFVLPESNHTAGDVRKLVDLIIETIDDGTNPICDSEIKNKINYSAWYRLVLTTFNSCDDEAVCRYLYDKLFPCYRHYNDIQAEHYWDSLFGSKDQYSGLTYASLHYWARSSPKYKEMFPIKTFKEIMATRVHDRTPFEQRFVDRIINRITEENIKFLMKATFIQPLLDHSEYVQPHHFNTYHKVCCIKAGLGRGKSTATITHIKETKYDNIIILTPRRSYAKSCCDRMVEGTGISFQCYLQLKKSFIDTPFIVIQAESLYRLNIREGKSLLIMDEVEAFLYQLTSTQTHAENHIRNIETFMSLVKHSQKILALDAFLSNRTLRTFDILLGGITDPLGDRNQSIRGFNKKGFNKKGFNKKGSPQIQFVNYTQQLQERRVTRVDNMDLFISKLITDLGEGKKIFLFSSSNSKLLKRKRKVYKNPDREDVIINALLPAIREKFPDKNILEFHSNYVSLQLKNVNDQWANADLVACTSTITVGINHDLPNVFHKLYLYANASSCNLVRDMFQASYRVRHLIDNEMVCCIDKAHYGKNLTTNYEEIKTGLQDRHTSIINHFKNYGQKEYPHQTPKFIEYLATFNKLESNFSIMNLEDFFNAYLKECNYQYHEDPEDIIEIEFDEFIKPQIDYDQIVEILPSKAKELIQKKKRSPLTEEENSSLEKYHFQNILLYRPKDVEKPLWEIYTNFGKGKFRNISTEKGLVEGTITIKDIIDKNSYSHLNNGFSMRCQVISEIFNWIGCNSQDYTTKIKRDTVTNLIHKFEENRKKIHIAFDIKQTKGELNVKSTIGLINSVLSKWGYSKIKKGKREVVRKNGKKVDVSDFEINNINNELDVHKYIKPRTISQDERIHPLLLRPEDKNIITTRELEDIRLRTCL